MQSEQITKPLARPKRKKLLLIVGAVFVLLVAAGGMLVLVRLKGTPPIDIPDVTAQKVLFPIYLPTKLPKGYAMPQSAISQQEQTLLFYVKREGHRITFSEQPLPKDFDLTAFHTRGLNNSKSLQNTPYPSVLGIGDQDTYVLSVTTNETWIIATCKAPTAKEDLELVARHLEKR
jgi:hypothetical protein